MAAILQPHPDLLPPLAPSAPRRPDLRVIQGGRADRTRRTYRRRRLLVALAALVVMVGAVAVGRGAFASFAPAPASSAHAAGASAAAPGSGLVVVVRPGDTLWAIARRLQPQGDVRGLVDRLAASHGAGSLQPGDRITVRR